MVTRFNSFLETYHYQLLWAILCLGLLLRVLAFLSLKSTAYFDFLLWDERLYHVWAEKIASGTFESSTVYEFAPLPAYFIALLYKCFQPDPVVTRLMNIVLGLFMCLVVYWIGKEVGSRKTGLFACLLATLYEPFIFYSIVPLKTTLSLFLFACSVFLVISTIKRETCLKAVLLGVAISLAYNVRPNVVVLVPFFFCLIAWRIYISRRQAVFSKSSIVLIAYLVGVVAVLLPFAIRNYAVAGEFALTASQSGFNLFAANSPNNPTCYYRPVSFATSSPFEQGIQFTIEASRRTGRRLSATEASSYWTWEAVRSFTESPTQGFKKGVCKVLAGVNAFEAGDHYEIGFIKSFADFFQFPFPRAGLVLPFGLAGFLLTIRRGRSLPLLGAIVFLYGMTLVIFFTSARLRLPLFVILVPISVLGVERFCFHVRQRRFREIGIYVGLVGAFFLLEHVELPGSDDMTAYYNTHAIVLDSQGREKEAIEYWKRSSRMNKSYSVFANLSLAGRFLKQKNPDSAMGYLNKISDESFGAAQKYELMGDTMMSERNVEGAVRAYEKSLSINGGQRKVRQKLVAIYKGIDKRRAQVEYEKLRYISSFYDLL